MDPPTLEDIIKFQADAIRSMAKAIKELQEVRDGHQANFLTHLRMIKEIDERVEMVESYFDCK